MQSQSFETIRMVISQIYLECEEQYDISLYEPPYFQLHQSFHSAKFNNLTDVNRFLEKYNKRDVLRLMYALTAYYYIISTTNDSKNNGFMEIIYYKIDGGSIGAESGKEYDVPIYFKVISSSLIRRRLVGI